MKFLFRMFVFSAIALYATSFIMKGSFVISTDPKNIALAAVLVAAVHYLARPIMKIIFLPLNIITIGLFSFVAYILLFNFMINSFGYITIHPWTFPGISAFGYSLAKTDLNYWMTLFSSSFMLSFFINLLELLL